MPRGNIDAGQPAVGSHGAARAHRRESQGLRQCAAANEVLSRRKRRAGAAIDPDAGAGQGHVGKIGRAVAKGDTFGVATGGKQAGNTTGLFFPAPVGRTQAAVEFVCRQSSVEGLLLRLPVSNSGQLKPFEAVLRVKVTRGVPVGTELIALRSGIS